jgi:4-diphosphocytidyl-2-C-methyl-D-erythritol kinase
MAAADPTDGRILREPALAKVNLYLHVVGRRADGLHLLDSLIVFVGIGDEIEAEEAADIDLAVAGPFADALAGAPPGHNLILRAARMLRAEGGVRSGASIRLHKALPVAAGLGGGSADAAATLRALSALWRLAPAPGDLARLALKLGADVPVCLGGRAAIVAGIGERLAPAPALPPAQLVLVNPRTPLATACVFGAREGAFSHPAGFAETPADATDLAALLATRANDLETPARRLKPAIDDALSALAGVPGCLIARMSGSGATCFGMFATDAEAAAAAKRLADRRPEWWIAAAPLVNQVATDRPVV